MITKTQAADIHAELQAAVDAVLTRHGFARDRSRMRYGETDLKVTVEATLAGTDRRANAFDTYAPSFGIPIDALGGLFVSRGEVFEVLGLEPKNRRYPLIAKKHSDGKTYKFPVTGAVVDQLRNPAPELAR